MSDSGFASLGPTLLARKGGAKPAMRPQVAPLMVDETQIAALAEEQLEDLGWNDMGDSESSSESGAGADVVVPISAAVTPAEAVSAHSPIVRRQRRRLEERVLADAAMTGPEYAAGVAQAAEEEGYADDCAAADHAPLAPPPSPGVGSAKVRRTPRTPARRSARTLAPVAERRAAFTLRLDPERHLKLRLAATMQGVSAQALVTEALDAMLAEFDELDVIAAHLKRH
ncbi:toxin-antitoxin system HicB family antitoxin [Erythrobacter tepidarius]|uniref:toxin-antitoxin system HicB family antitoxin n=1 Tax=Erythrobacter tepidarius TaxID=60454 RepID=UPI001FE3B275|nr:toxin-antitoxin system HicB family antitoxin [Erythrobacter tepidarius]